MSVGYLLIDANNLGYACHSARPLHMGDMQVQAIYNFIRSLRATISTFDKLKPIVLWDGKHGKAWRKMIYRDYNANRLKPAETKHEIAQAEARKAYAAQRPYIAEALGYLGVTQITADNLEADDLAGMLVRKYAPKGSKIVLLSADKDWAQLVQPGVGWLDPINKIRIGTKTITEVIGYTKEVKDRKTKEVVSSEWRGVPSARAFLEMKALVGDTSDGIPGVGGIGDKGAIELLIKFGSVSNFLHQANLERLPLPAKLEAFATDLEKQRIFARNMDLMDLASKRIPAPVNLEVAKRPLDKEKFREFCTTFVFRQILTDFDDWIQNFEGIEGR